MRYRRGVPAAFMLAATAGCFLISPTENENAGGVCSLESVSLTPMPSELVVGQSVTTTLTAIRADGATCTPDQLSQVSWSSDAPDVARVSGDGNVAEAVGVSPGTAIIKASMRLANDSALVNVDVLPTAATSVAVSPASASRTVGQTQQFSVQCQDANMSATLCPGTVLWGTNPNPSPTASISAGGLLTANAPGSVTVTATIGGLVGSATVTVTTSTRPPASVVVTPPSALLTPGQTRQFSAECRDSGGIATPCRDPVVWTTIPSPSATASISTGGLLTAEEVGTVTVSAAVGSLVGTATTTVTASTGFAIGDLFSTRWTNGTGNGVAAITDGGRFSNPANGEYFGTGTRTLDVVTAASVGLPDSIGGVLRIRIRNQGWGQMTAVNAVPQSTTHWGRVYYRSNSGRRSQHGSGYMTSAAGGSFNHWQLLSLEHYGGADASSPLRWAIRMAAPYPNSHAFSPQLSKGTWYRFEWQVEYVTATTVRIWPRIYDLAGNLLYDSDDFTNEENSGSLTALYGGGHTILLGSPEDAPSAEEARDFTIGSEGPSDANGYDPATPAYIYMAAFDFSSVGWIGR